MSAALAQLAIFSSSFVIALSGALAPGPLLTVTITESARRGAMTGPLLILGHGILELAMVALLLAGAGPLLESDRVFSVIAFAGTALLLFMGIGLLRSLPHGLPDRATPGGGTRILKNPLVAGILMSLANPYWTIWWAAIGLGYVTYAGTYGIAGVVSFFCGHILADFAWYSFVSFGISRGRSIMSAGAYRCIRAVCGIALIFFGAWFFHAGLTRLAAWT